MVTIFSKNFFQLAVTIEAIGSSKECMTPTNEEDIIHKIIAGNTELFSILVDRYKDLVFTLAVRILKHQEEAEEASQDTFVKAFKSLKKFKGDSKFSTWIYKITYNTCLDRIKKQKKRYHEISLDAEKPVQVPVIDNALSQLIEHERSEKIKRCLQQLPGDEAFLLTLYYFEEQSMEEISKVVDMTPNHVKVKLHRSRKKLAVILKEHLETEIIDRYEKSGR